MNSFLNTSNLLRLYEELSESCEGEITLKECETILNFFKTGKTPGNDGIPVEFYRVFWPLLGKFMVDSFNEAYNKKEMSHSLQKQAVITLIEKKGKDRNYLENWRPISLINVDAKIASKVIATRVIKVLPEIIHCNQTGYVKGRFIGEAAYQLWMLWITHTHKTKTYQGYCFSLTSLKLLTVLTGNSSHRGCFRFCEA